MADIQQDDLNDVRSAIAQLQGGFDKPAPIEDITSRAVAEHDRDAEAALDRIAKRVDEEIDRQEPEKVSRRNRDAAGRFAKAEPFPSHEVLSESQRLAGEATKILDETDAKRQEDRELGPPAALNGDLKSRWQELPQDVREEFIRLEAAGKKGVESLKASQRELDQVLAPRREANRRYGHATDAAAVSHLFQISDSYERNPAATALHLFAHMPPDAQNAIRQQLGLQPVARPQLTEQELDHHVGMRQASMDVQRFEQDERYAAGMRHPEVRSVMQQALLSGHAYDLPSAHDVAVLHLMQQGGELPEEVVGLVVAKHEIAQFAAANEFFPLLQDTMKKLLETEQAVTLREAYDKSMAQHPRLRSLSAYAVDLDKKKKAAGASLHSTGTGSGQPRPARRVKPNSWDDYTDSVRDAISQLS